MVDPEALLAEFKTAYESGERPDLLELLERAPESERQALRERIDSYLMQAPRRSWDPEAYERSPARESVERVWESVEGVSGSWPKLLPHLRHRARIKRAELVHRLAGALGVGDREAKVASYYHAMEHGRLPAEGISARVFAALGEILDVSAERIREAGSATLAPPESGGPATTYTRMALGDEYGAAAEPAAPAEPSGEAEAGRDQVDELFTGG